MLECHQDTDRQRLPPVVTSALTGGPTQGSTRERKLLFLFRILLAFPIRRALVARKGAFQMLVPVSPSSLRRTIASKAYWSSSSNQRDALSSWVRSGFQALEDARGERRTIVFVRAYTRQRDGRIEHVDAHQRRVPHRDEDSLRYSLRQAADDGHVRDAQCFLPRPPGLLARPPLRPGQPMERIPHQSGADGRKKCPELGAW